MRNHQAVTLCAFIMAGFLTGVCCVLFMRGFEFVLKNRLDFQSAGAWCWLFSPLLFLLSVEMVRRIAPCAAGTGIPQAIFAARHLGIANEEALAPLVSPATLAVKVVSLLIGIWAGASTGREGPTVHVATCVFIMILWPFRRWAGVSVDPRSAVIAGGAAGLAAAFNTPLAGVTFAIEELTTDYFSNIKDLVLLAIIVAAVAAKLLTGEYAYFGKLLEPPVVPLTATFVIGLVGGLLGAFFSSAILHGQKIISRFNSPLSRYGIPVALSLGVLVIASFVGLNVLGPGNEVAKTLIFGQFGPWAILFPLAKIGTTLFTYLSGIAGGIFAPCLSIGAAMGADVGRCLNVSTASCAMIGMAAFLSGTIQAPITSFVIIFEMTGHHQMLLPIMLSSLLAFMVARVLGAKHFYQALATNYNYLLGSS